MPKRMSNYNCARCEKRMPQDVFKPLPYYGATMKCPYCDYKVFTKERKKITRKVKAI